MNTPMTPEGKDHLHVALLADGLTPFVLGGMQRHSRMLLEHLAMLGGTVSVFHHLAPGHAARTPDTLDWVPPAVRPRVHSEIIDYPPGGRMPGHYLREQAALSRRMLDRYMRTGCRADFIYAQGLTACAFLDERERGTPLPPIGANLHGLNMFQRAANLKAGLQNIMMRPAFRRVACESDVLFCFSGKIRAIAEHRLGVKARRIVEMPNAVDASWIARSETKPSTRRRFTFIGRHDRCKGLPELLAATERLGEGAWSLRIVGPVPERCRSVRPGIEYTGPVNEPARIIQLLDDSDCLVCPSHSEGMPTVVIEAMARGNAVIATDVGATRELVDDQVGVLIDRPDVRLIAEAVSEVAGMDVGRLQQLKAAALARATRYTWPRVAAMHMDAIAACLARKKLSEVD